MKHLFIIMFSLFNLFSQTACSQQPRIEWHGFEFNATADMPEVDVIEYQYGSSEAQGTANSIERSHYLYGDKGSKGFHAGHRFGDTPVGEFLFVKWRDKATQKIHEDKIDLRKRLPDDLYGKTVYFLIDNNQVYVYLIPYSGLEDKENHRTTNQPPNGPPINHYLDVKTIYPDNDPPKVRGGKQ